MEEVASPTSTSHYREIPQGNFDLISIVMCYIDPRPTYEETKDVKNCRKCNVEFGIFTHKHHCHGCGKIYCKKDCDLFLQLPDSFGYAADTPVRVCETCFKKYIILYYE